MSNDVNRQQNAAYREMKAAEGSPRVRKEYDYVVLADVGPDYVASSVGQIKTIRNYDLDSIERTGDNEFIDYVVNKWAGEEDGIPLKTESETIKAPPIAPLVTAETPTYNQKPVWTWDKVGVEYEVSYDNITFFSVGLNNSFQAYLPLLPGDWTLYVRAKNIDSDWGEVGQFTVNIQVLNVKI